MRLVTGKGGETVTILPVPDMDGGLDSIAVASRVGWPDALKTIVLDSPLFTCD